MSKIIGVENTERINAELEKLIEEVKQRTKTTITGVRIPDLGEAQTIDGSEMIIIEGKAGTQRTLATNIPNQEVIDSRGGEQTLGDRLDKIVKNINDNTNNIIANANAINISNKEVIDARTDNQLPSTTYPTLKDRIDGIETTANQANNTANANALQINTINTTQAQHENRIDLLEQNNGVNQEVVDARGGETTLGNRLDKMTTATTDAKAVADKADAKSIQNETRINNILNSMISFRVI